MRPLNFDATITVRTNADLRRAIDAAAQRENTTASDWLRRAVAAIVRHNDPYPSSPAVVPAAALLVAA